MTTIYFVRHAQPDFRWEEDMTRPLTEEGQADTRLVVDFFKNIAVDEFYCSPYLRSVQTIAGAAEAAGKEIHTDMRLREREKGKSGNVHGMFQLRWADKEYHEPGGESIHMVQKRNIEALSEILKKEEGKTIVIGTHGTALSSILNYYDESFQCDDFLRIIDWMPYILELDFEKETLVGKKEHAYLYKEFKGTARADKK